MPASLGSVKRYANGLYGVMRCSADACDAGNYKVERQSDGTVLLRMTGGLNVGGGTDNASRRLPDGHVYRLVARPDERVPLTKALARDRLEARDHRNRARA
jgi:hypothetical protein